MRTSPTARSSLAGKACRYVQIHSARSQPTSSTPATRWVTLSSSPHQSASPDGLCIWRPYYSSPSRSEFAPCSIDHEVHSSSNGGARSQQRPRQIDDCMAFFDYFCSHHSSGRKSWFSLHVTLRQGGLQSQIQAQMHNPVFLKYLFIFSFAKNWRGIKHVYMKENGGDPPFSPSYLIRFPKQRENKWRKVEKQSIRRLSIKNHHYINNQL